MNNMQTEFQNTTQNTVIIKKDQFDKFYTKNSVAKFCVEKLLNYACDDYLFIEPSAGSGAFCDALLDFGVKNFRAFDIQPTPKRNSAYLIYQRDFFVYKPHGEQKLAFIGNPPFGKCANMAVKFFNHAASFLQTEIIAFIVPKTFQKISIHNKLNVSFAIVSECELLKNSFLLNGQSYDVPCVFQIWQRCNTPRVALKLFEEKYLKFVTKSEADFAIRRVGGNAGKVLQGLEHNPSTTYFCKVLIPDIKRIVGSIDFSQIANATAGVRSISKLEIQMAINKYYNEI